MHAILRILKPAVLITVLITCSRTGSAQKINSLSDVGSENSDEYKYRSSFITGIFVGGNYSWIDGLDRTILSEPFFLEYSLKKKQRTGINAGIFINYRDENFASNLLGIHVELGYSQQGSDLNFKNFQKDFTYRIQFKYNYINLNALLKYYIADYDNAYQMLPHLNAFAGMRVGINTTPSNIIYTSGGTGYEPAFGSDLAQQQQLQNVLKGKSSVGLVFGVGYEARFFSIDARYNHGLNDVVETKSNSYNFIENHNANSFFQFTLAYNLDFNRP